MIYEIKILIRGGPELKREIEKGYIQEGMSVDVFPDDEILSFSAQEITEYDENSIRWKRLHYWIKWV